MELPTRQSLIEKYYGVSFLKKYGDSIGASGWCDADPSFKEKTKSKKFVNIGNLWMPRELFDILESESTPKPWNAVLDINSLPKVKGEYSVYVRRRGRQCHLDGILFDHDPGTIAWWLSTVSHWRQIDEPKWCYPRPSDEYIRKVESREITRSL